MRLGVKYRGLHYRAISGDFCEEVVTATLTATPSSDLNAQVGSFRDEQEVLLGYRCLQRSQAASRSRRKEAEIHKRLRMQNTGEKRSLLIPVRARVGKRSRTMPGESY